MDQRKCVHEISIFVARGGGEEERIKGRMELNHADRL